MKAELASDSSEALSEPWLLVPIQHWLTFLTGNLTTEVAFPLSGIPPSSTTIKSSGLPLNNRLTL